MEVRVIAANGVVADGQSMTSDENDASVAVLITYGDFTAFYGGDIEERTEGRIAASNLVVDVDLYQANHHGASTSSSVDFIEKLSPKVVIVSNGSHATYAHPRRDVLERLQGLTPVPDIFQTNKFTDTGCRVCLLSGNVTNTHILDLDPDGRDGSIDVVVESGGDFTVWMRFLDSFGPY